VDTDISNKPRPAIELQVEDWIDREGNRAAPLRLADLGEGYKVIYCFQHWCPGCHSYGFPALKRLVESLEGHGFGFAAIQTVFEGAHANTRERLRENQLKYALQIPFGHDHREHARPITMDSYKTGGTPWFLVINPEGQLVFSNFRLDVDALISSVLASQSRTDGAVNDPSSPG
jgi:thiol-disulfide isomerase/thioredoxin